MYKEYPPLDSKQSGTKDKIGLIAFHDYHSEGTVTGKIKRFWSVLDEERKYFGELETIAKPIKNYPLTKTVPLTENTKILYDIYTRKFGNKNVKELDNLFEFNGVIPIGFKDRNLDYYILGEWSPNMAINRRNNFLLGVPQIITTLACVVSLCTIPAWQTYSVDLKVYVFDRKLKLIKTTTIEDRTHMFISWWFTPNDKNSDEFMGEGEDYGSREISYIAKKKILDYTATKFKRENFIIE
jgi:hypothetical protein